MFKENMFKNNNITNSNNGNINSSPDSRNSSQTYNGRTNFNVNNEKEYGIKNEINLLRI